jgi:alkaline phosphatase D
MRRMTRRAFLATAAETTLLAAGATGLASPPRAAAALSLSRVDAVPTGVTRTWIAPQYWSNRLADWRLANGRIESLTAGAKGGRSVAVLTRSIVSGQQSGALSVRTGTLATGSGLSGFLVGAGGGQLHWKAAALVMGASGEGGGILATYDSDGNVRFRDHTSETNQFAYAELAATGRSGPAPARTTGEDVVLLLEITPVVNGRLDLTLTATRFDNGALLSQATLAGVADAAIVGGILMFSSPRSGGTTARHWFRELQTGGAKVAVLPHETGPVLATQYSLSGTVLKLGAQFMPIGASEPQQATLERRSPGATEWTTAQTATIGTGYLALFRVTGWDPTQDWEFRVSWAQGTAQQAFYTGTVRKNPAAKSSIDIAMVNCTIHSWRMLERASSGAQNLPGASYLGLYTPKNLYFPYAELVANIQRQQPDILVAFGDQYYENRPTMVDKSQAVLDVLYRYYLWLWSFGELTRTMPSICLVDDHDVYHPNLWGWSGARATNGYTYGGYIMPASWVNTVQRVQCAHNPDPYDATTVLQGITVYYGAFSYGGVSFAMLEDRKFKNNNKTGTNPDGTPLQPPRDLLGARQESFLQAWASMHPGQPKVCLTQTAYACVQTSLSGGPMKNADSDGTPVPARRTAVSLVKAAHALLLSGDQHLGSLIRHGIDTYIDGPVQFTAPAAGSSWQRWFEPANALPNSRGPNTGDFSDGYGNKFRVLAVANPNVTFAQVRSVQNVNDVGDRAVKSEGYGIVRVDKDANRFHLECWPWATDPTVQGASQYAEWPYDLPFASA